MRRGMFLLICCLLPLCLGVASCEKLGTPAVMGELKHETLKSLDAIPLDYGNLVAVTTTSTHPDWGHLWFERADRTIVVVSVNRVTGQMWEKVLAIPRR